MRTTGSLVMALAIGCGIACGTEQPPPRDGGKEQTTVNDRPATTSPPAAERPAASPSDTIRAFSEAVRRKDAGGVKRLLTAGSLRMLEGGASSKNMSIDEFVVKGGDMPFADMPEILGEKIDGDTARVDVQYRGEKDTVVLEKVDGVWKIAFDKT